VLLSADLVEEGSRTFSVVFLALLVYVHFKHGWTDGQRKRMPLVVESKRKDRDALILSFEYYVRTVLVLLLFNTGREP
jgi:hypothetical protein